MTATCVDEDVLMVHALVINKSINWSVLHNKGINPMATD